MTQLPWMPILTYHRIVETEPLSDPDRVCTSVARLECHLDWLLARSYAGVPIDLALRPAESGEGRRFAITFDDGYEETLRLALPVLQARSLPATVFVVSGCIGGSAVWNHQAAPLLSRDELLYLQSNGIFIGSHGRSHRRLSTLSSEEIREEVFGSRDDLEQLLGTPVRFFSYPHHDLDGRVLALAAEAAYAGSVGGRSGVHGRYNLHRIDAWRMTTWQLALHVTGLHRWGRRQPLPRAVRQLAARLA
jgi:peptidoglycan/xylan/chitin deacetylase (PgdA/CDA1 family)